MKPLSLLIGLALATLTLSPQPAQAEVSFGFFYSSLSEHGEWWDHPDYGYCWRPFPARIPVGWRPYSDGYWAYTDYGWTWVSYEDWGWATYHYGRWALLPDYGWVWVPGYEWAPAWVSWRISDDYIGWAPLPPRARWDWNVGFSFWVDRDYDIGPGYYNFCHVRHIGAPWIRRHLVPVEQNVTVIRNTVNITQINVQNHTTVNRKVIYTGGPDYRKISARSERPVPKYKLARIENPDALASLKGKDRTPKARGDTLEFIAPEIRPGISAAPPTVRKLVSSKPADTGWTVVRDSEEQKRLRKKISDEAGEPGRNPTVNPVASREIVGFEPDPPKSRDKESKGPPHQVSTPGSTSPTEGSATAGTHGRGELLKGPLPGKGTEELAAREEVRRKEAERLRQDAALTARKHQEAMMAAEEARKRAVDAEAERRKQAEQAEVARRRLAETQELRRKQYEAMQQKAQEQRQKNRELDLQLERARKYRQAQQEAAEAEAKERARKYQQQLEEQQNQRHPKFQSPSWQSHKQGTKQGNTVFAYPGATPEPTQWVPKGGRKSADRHY